MNQKVDSLIDVAKERFRKEAPANWKLNERILELSVTKFFSLKEAGFLDNEDQIVRFSLLMATEFE